MKACTKCNVEKDLADFHKHSSSKDGYHWKCKKCVAHYQKELKAKYKKERDKLPKESAAGETKTCTKCLVVKELSEFNKDVGTKDGHKPSCRACYKKYKDANKDKTAAYNLANKEHIDKRNKKYFKNNKEKIYAYRKTEKVASKRKKYLRDNAEKLSAQQKKWNSENKGLVRAYRAKRRAQIKQATVPWADIKAIKKLYVDSVRITKESGIEYQVDHIIPLQHNKVCGLHCEANLQILKASENLSKGNKLLYESNKGEMK